MCECVNRHARTQAAAHTRAHVHARKRAREHARTHASTRARTHAHQRREVLALRAPNLLDELVAELRHIEVARSVDEELGRALG